MAEVIKVYRQKMPKMKLVGKCYFDKDRENGMFANKWEEWFKNDWFSPLLLPDCGNEPFEDCNAYVGMCRCTSDEPFQYWIGVFMPIETEVPEGYDSIVFDESEIAVYWILGKEPDVYNCCCISRLGSDGMNWATDKDGVHWMFERYVCPRFTVPNEDGNIILDLCYFISDK